MRCAPLGTKVVMLLFQVRSHKRVCVTRCARLSIDVKWTFFTQCFMPQKCIQMLIVAITCFLQQKYWPRCWIKVISWTWLQFSLFWEHWVRNKLFLSMLHVHHVSKDSAAVSGALLSACFPEEVWGKVLVTLRCDLTAKAEIFGLAVSNGILQWGTWKWTCFNYTDP